MSTWERWLKIALQKEDELQCHLEHHIQGQADWVTCSLSSHVVSPTDTANLLGVTILQKTDSSIYVVSNTAAL